LVGAQVALLSRKLGIRHPAVWVTVPTAAPIVERGRWSTAVFNRSDDFSAFPEADASLIAPLEQRLLRRADRVAYVNRVLYDREHASLRDSQFIGHGVDFNHFASARPAGVPPAH